MMTLQVVSQFENQRALTISGMPSDEELAKAIVDILSEAAAKAEAEGQALPHLRSLLNSSVETA